MSRNISWAALAATALLGSTAFTSGAFAADPIKIGVSGPFTGGSASMGVQHARRRQAGGQ